MLGEAAEIMLGAMRGLGERLNEAETAEAAQGLAMALARVNRGLRQTLLLDARLEKDARAVAQAAEVEAAQAREAEVQARKHRLRYAASREILEACDSAEEAEPYLDELEGCLDAYVRGHDFETGTLEDLVETLLSDLGFGREDEDEEEHEDEEEDGADVADEAAPAPEASAVTEPDPAAPPEASGPPRRLRLVDEPDFGYMPGPEDSS